MSDSDETSEPVFKDLNVDEETGLTQIESLCMNCHEQGITKLLLTRIPHFRNVILSSFSCDHCDYENNEVQSAESIQDEGVKVAVTVRNVEDLNRQVVRSTECTVSIPAVDFTIPPCKGELTTIEGLISTAVSDLEQQQPVRRIMEPETAAKLDEFISKLKPLTDVQQPFEIVFVDPTGNSFVQNPFAPRKDEYMKIEHFTRSIEEDERLGITAEGFENDNDNENEDAEKEANFKNEVVTFKVDCPHCGAMAESNMKVVDIPHFKEVILMAFNCQYCGYRDNEVKGGMSIEDKGMKLTLHVTDPLDLSRDILKSDTSGLSIPEIDFVASDGTLGGRFTTLEGLLDNIIESIGQSSGFSVGDSAAPELKDKLADTCKKIEELKKRVDWHFVLDDPAGNSYIQNVYAPDDDPELKVEHYERNQEQNADLGLSDMKTENYET